MSGSGNLFKTLLRNCDTLSLDFWLVIYVVLFIRIVIINGWMFASLLYFVGCFCIFGTYITLPKCKSITEIPIVNFICVNAIAIFFIYFMNRMGLLLWVKCTTQRLWWLPTQSKLFERQATQCLYGSSLRKDVSGFVYSKMYRYE